MWKLSIVDDRAQTTTVNLVRDDYSVGRAEGNTIRLTEQNVSRHHCFLRRTPFGYRIEDKGSYNGVFVNGVRVIGAQELAHRDVIQLADYRIELIDEALDTQEQSHRPFPDLLPPASGRLPDRLVVLIGPNQGHEFVVEAERHLLGRGDECDFLLDHASVSRVHAEVRRVRDGRFEIVDKGSANGLRVNGHEMPKAILDSRDVVELGDVVLKFIPHGQVFHAGPGEGQRIAALGGASPPPPKALPPNLRTSLIAALTGAAAAAIIGGLYLQNRTPPEKTVRSATLEAPGSNEIAAASPLTRARVLLEQGAVQEAHQLALEVPADSADRKSPEYLAIEEAWARLQLRRAEAEPDLNARRSLLDQVARAEGVSPELRQTALDSMQALAGDSVDLSDLATGTGRTRPSRKTR